MRKTVSIRTLGAAVALALPLAAAAQSAAPSADALMKKLEALTQELENVKAELQKVKQQQTVQAQQTQTAAPAAAARSQEPDTALTAYGEINYNRPTKDSSAAQTDVRRFVLGYQHRFDAQTRVVTELEVEHAVASKEDDGEVEVEQAYVEHRFSADAPWGMRAGLFLMPVGLLNLNHEPTAYYGVERNFVETAIIPTTLREAGLQLFGEHANGLSWAAGVSTSPNLQKWDPTSGEGAASPLGAIHQEGQLAASKGLTWFGALDWRGMPGLQLGASALAGRVAHGQSGFAAPDARYTLWDVHARWQPGAWDFAALYARGGFANVAPLNASFAGAAFLVPKRFDGWYLQGAYRFALGGEMAIAPFARYERFNTGRGFDGVDAAAYPAYPTEAVTTVGANFYLNRNVVVKADYQRFRQNQDANRINLGLGWSF